MFFANTQWYSEYVSIFKFLVACLTAKHPLDACFAFENFVAQAYVHVLLSVLLSSTPPFNWDERALRIFTLPHSDHHRASAAPPTPIRRTRFRSPP